MKKKRTIFLGIFCALIWTVLIILVIYNSNLNKEKDNTQYLLINDLHYYKYEKSNWHKLDIIGNYNSVSKEINWKDYDIFIKNKYYNTYKFAFTNSKEYLFDNNENSQEIPENKILLNKNSFIKLRDFKTSSFTIDDNRIIENLLNKNNYSYNSLTVKIKYNISLTENLYIVSNYVDSYSEDDMKNVFYLVFYRNNSTNYILIKGNEDVGFRNYDLAWILDMKSKYNNFILSYDCYEDICYDIYQYNYEKKNFSKVSNY